MRLDERFHSAQKVNRCSDETQNSFRRTVLFPRMRDGDDGFFRIFHNSFLLVFSFRRFVGAVQKIGNRRGGENSGDDARRAV